MTQPPPPEPVIELGEFRYDTEPSPAAGPDPEALSPRWHQTIWTHRRRWPAVLVGALALLLGGSGIGQVSPLEQVVGLPADASASQMVATDDVLYLLVMPGSGDAGRLEAHRWRDGTQLWSTPVAEPEFQAQLRLVGEVPVLTSTNAESEEATAYDPATGQPRWSHPGVVLGGVTDGVLLGGVTGSPIRGGAEGRLTQIGAVDQVTGELLWQRGMDLEDMSYDYGSDPLRVLVELGPDGQLTQYDPATGAVVGSVQTAVGQDGAHDSTGPDELPGVTQFALPGGDTLYLPAPAVRLGADYVMVTEPTELVAYELDGFEVRWRIDRSSYAWMTPCGDLVCALGSFVTVDDSGDSDGGDPDPVDDLGGSAGQDDPRTRLAATTSLVGLDPMTGEVRWSRECAEDVDPDLAAGSNLDSAGVTGAAGQCFFTLPDSPVDGVVTVGRIVVTPDRESEATLVLDATTGELLERLERWSRVGLLGEDILFHYSTAGQYSAGPPEETAEPDSRWLGRWLTDDSRFQMLGQLDVEWCQPIAADYLSCVGPSADDTGIWRIR